MEFVGPVPGWPFAALGREPQRFARWHHRRPAFLGLDIIYPLRGSFLFLRNQKDTLFPCVGSEPIFLGVDSFSIQASFFSITDRRVPWVSKEVWKEGSLERMDMEGTPREFTRGLAGFGVAHNGVAQMFVFPVLRGKPL